HGRCHGGAFLRVPSGGIVFVHLLGNSSLPIGHIIMGFTIDNALKRIIIVTVENRIPNAA
ncbi:MAG: hypothetical protein ACK56I_20960, partial [bacterium]